MIGQVLVVENTPHFGKNQKAVYYESIAMAARALPVYVEEEKKYTFGVQIMPLIKNNTGEELVNLIKQQSQKGFNMLYDNYSEALFGVIGRIINDSDIAEDILQETFVKIWRNIDQYDDCKGTFFTWMLNIARNTSIDYLRSRQHIQRKKSCTDEVLTNAKDKNISSFNEEHIGVKKIVLNLEPQYREVIDLLYFNGYTQEEVAEALNIPLGTVKTRARKAIQILRDQF